MKVAVASSGQWLDSMVDEHFGRARCFIVYDTSQDSHEVIDNWQCLECVHWAGTKSVDRLAQAGVSSVIVRYIGPNAFRMLAQAGIDVLFTEESSVVDAVRRFREGKLLPAKAPNCNGHKHLR